MARSKARTGFRATLEIALAASPSTFTYIAETISHTPPSFTDATIEVTHLQSPEAKEYIASSLPDAGESSHEMNYVPGSATDVFLTGLRGKDLIARLTFPNGRQMIYNAVRSSYETGSLTAEDRATATLTLKVSGSPVLTAVAAPRNLEAPVIEGVAKVGVPLTVEPGSWAGGADLTYQWKIDGSNVSGQTAQSYVPVSGDSGKVATCAVTCANASFSTSATTAGSGTIAA